MAVRRRITFLVTTLTRGGAENQVRLLARGLARRGWDVQVVAMARPSAYEDELRDAGVDVVSLEMRSRVPMPGQLVALVQALRHVRPDVLHAHMWRANILARLVRPLGRPRVLVCTAHNVTEGGAPLEGQGAVDWAYRLTDRLGDMTTNVSRSAVERYVRVRAAPARRIRYMPNGTDMTELAPTPGLRGEVRAALGVDEGVFVWLAAGRLHRQKDYATLLRAFEGPEAGPSSVELWIAGTGPEEAALRGQARDAGLDGRVRFLGLRSDVPALMQAADAYAMSSLWEGLPIVLLEAAGSGLPIVSTRVGGTSEVVRDGETGFLVPPGQPEALRDAMARVMALDATARRGLGDAGRALVEREYALDGVLDQWEQLYAELLAARSR